MNKILKCGVALIGASAAVIALIGCSSINNSKNKNILKLINIISNIYILYLIETHLNLYIEIFQ